MPRVDTCVAQEALLCRHARLQIIILIVILISLISCRTIRAPSGSLTGPLGSLRSTDPIGHAADLVHSWSFCVLL